MANAISRYEVLLGNPNIQGALWAIRGPEGTALPGDVGYTVRFGGSRFDPTKSGWQRPRGTISAGGYRSNAAGAYQILDTTWDEVAKKLDLKDFSPRNQDLAALALMERRGVNLDDIAQRGFDPSWVHKLAPEWASLPTAAGKSYYGQPVKPIETIKKYFEEGVARSAKGAPQTAGAPFPGRDAAAGGLSLGSNQGLTTVFEQPTRAFAGGLGMVPLDVVGGLGVTSGLAAGALATQRFMAQLASGTGAPEQFAGSLRSGGLDTARPAQTPEASGPAPGSQVGSGQVGSGGQAVPFRRSVSTSFDTGQPGIDLYFEDKQFRALLPGRVKDIGFQGSGRGASGKGYGNYVVVESIDPETKKTVDLLYGHLDQVGVQRGQQIAEGHSIGKQGGTGRVLSQDGTIASVDFLEPAPAGSGSMKPYAHYDGLRRRLAKRWSV